MWNFETQQCVRRLPAAGYITDIRSGLDFSSLINFLMFSSQRYRFNVKSCLKYACPCPKDTKPYFQVSRRKPGSQQKGLKLDIMIILCFIAATTRWRTPRALSSTTPATLSRQTNRSLKGWFPWIRFGNLCFPHHIKTITTTKVFAKQTSCSTTFQVSTKIAVSSTSIHLVDFDASSVLLTSWNFWTSQD